VIRFFVPGIPIAQPGSWSPKPGVVVTQSPASKGWKAAIASVVTTLGKPMLKGPVFVFARFFFPCTKKMTSTKRQRAARHYYTKQPDGDKLERPFFDALSKVLVEDDAYIVDHRTQKLYVPPGKFVGVAVVIEPASEELGLCLNDYEEERLREDA